jgi:hypothetical protein
MPSASLATSERDERRLLAVMLRGLTLALFGMFVTGCGGGAASNGVPRIAAANSVPRSVQSVAAPSALQRPQALTQEQGPTIGQVPGSESLCVGGTDYATMQDDEFSKDSKLNYTTELLTKTPGPNGAMWSSRANGFASDHSRNNVGTDDAYYTDPTRGFGGYNPYSLRNGALQITAVPVPPQYLNQQKLLGAHWLSGLLESPALQYGYVEISAKIPNLQGWWPAPLWLLGLYGDNGYGNGYEELDVNELFGNALPKSTVQQTQIFSPSGNPPAHDVRTVVVPDPSTVFHTYGVLWTRDAVRFYIDRVQRSPAYQNAANGPANAIINLAVFANHAFAPPPANKSPQTMYLQYYRWYQSKGTTCRPTIVPTSQPAPTPTPTPQNGPGIPKIVQNSGLITYRNQSTLLGQFSRAPQSGDVLVAYINAWTPVTAPKGWTRVDAPRNNGYFVFTGVVGKNGLSASKAYAFGLNWGTIDILDISGAALNEPILASADPNQYTPQFPRSLAIPKAHGLLLAGWGGFSYLKNGFNAINVSLPSGQTENRIGYSLNNIIGTYGSFSFRLDEITTDPFRAPNPFTTVASISASNWDFNGNLLWIPGTN